MKLIRQFKICEQDIARYIAANKRNDPRYTISSGPARYAYDPNTGHPINAWPERNLSTFDQAVEEATELRTRAREAARNRFASGWSTTPHTSIKSYTDWA